MQHFNFAGFLLTCFISLSAYCVVGFTMGFFASLLIPTVIVGGCWLYWKANQKKPSQRFQVALFGSAYYRMEVA